MIESKKGYPSVRHQCELLELSRAGHYRRLCVQPSRRQQESERLKAKIDRIHTECPFFGSREIMLELRSQGEVINRKRVQRLMREMHLKAICPKPNTSKPHPEHKIYSYLLRDVPIERVSLVDGHHLYSDERAACLSLCSNGLEKSLSHQWEHLLFNGRPLVQVRSARSFASWQSRDLQYRSRQPVYLS